MINGSLHTSQQKPGIEMVLSHTYLCMSLFNRMNPGDKPWRPTRWTEREQRRNKMKKGCWTSKILQSGNGPIKLLSCKHMLSFMKKKKKKDFEVRTGGQKGRAMGPEQGASRHRRMFLGLVT